MIWSTLLHFFSTAESASEKKETGMGEKREIFGASPIDILRNEFGSRRARNRMYSLRAFARQLSLGSGPLSEILVSKRSLTVKQGRKIADRLGYSPVEREAFLEAIRRLKDRREGAETSETNYRMLAADTFQLISDWYHYAIRELISTKGFRSDVAWIARRLGISRTEVQGALERLERLGAIKKIKNRWTAAGGLTTTQDVPSHALRKFHTQSLNRAIQALDEVPVALRDVTSITIPADLANLPAAKKAIKDFRRKMASLLEKGEPDEVYQLNVQLIPLTQTENFNA